MKNSKVGIVIFLILSFLHIKMHAQHQFTKLNTSINYNLLGISFADTNIGYACGDSGTVIKTTDGGNTWTPLTPGVADDGSPVTFWDIKVIPGSGGRDVIAVGDKNSIAKSVDGGITWQRQLVPLDTGSFVFGIQCLDHENYVACGGDFASFSGVVLKTTDGGTTWTKQAISQSVFLDKIFITPTGIGYTVGTNTSFTDGSIHRKLSDGSLWNPVKTAPDIVTNVWALNAAEAIAVGLMGRIWKTTDTGITWTDYSSDTRDLFGLQFRDSLNGFACGGDISGSVIEYTTDGGITWQEDLSYSYTGAFKAVSITGNKIFICGDAGTIVKGILSGVITSEQQQQSYESSLQIYPNPVTDRFIISLDVTGNKNYELIDMNGKRIARGAFSGRNTDVSTVSFNSGFYILRLYLENRLIAKHKLAIMK